VLASCGGLPPIAPPEIPAPVYPETYNTRISNLRTTLGRAGIGLRVAGIDQTFEVRTTRCVLAGEMTRVDGAVLEATTHAFSLYPTDVLVASKIDHVAICTDLVQSGDLDHPAGIADVESHGLLISVRYFIDRTYESDSSFTVDDIVHHEVFHLIEGAHYLADMTADSEWQLFNPMGFEYSPVARGDTRREGFVNTYAMTSAVEDKASVYEFMMARSGDLCDLARTDETIKIKSRIIWRRLLKAVGTDAFLRANAPCIDWLYN
jgi:hypothetical protein